MMIVNYSHLTLRRESEILIIQLLDPTLFGARTTGALESELLDLIEQEQPPCVVVDFERVKHCSTAVMNALLRVKRRVVTNSGGQLKLCGMIVSIRDAHKMLKLDGTVFDIYETVDEACADF
jgi:anti-anti-sigma regulatory factor